MSSLKPNQITVEEYLESLDDKKLLLAKSLIAFFEAITGYPAVMWNHRIVGFGEYAYRYASGHSGVSSLVGFAINRNDFVVYLNSNSEARDQLIAQLKPYKTGVGCCYFKSFEEINNDLFKQLIQVVIDDIQTLFPKEAI